jgi:putative salt-induced outer membrane protein
MKKLLIASALLAAMPFGVHAADDGVWKGAGELGFAASRGNSKSENLNAKLNFSMEDDTWKDNFYLTALRSKGEITTAELQNGQLVNVKRYDLTSNRYEAGASLGYKLDERSYIVGALRYEDDDFSPFDYQAVLSVGYGYTAIKNERTELSFEVGPGYKQYKPRPTPPATTADSENEVVGRGLIGFKYQLTDTTRFEDTFLIEAGADNKFMQNDAGLVVSMNKTLALKLGYQVRHNSDVAPGIKKTDQLMTTNLVYNF